MFLRKSHIWLRPSGYPRPVLFTARGPWPQLALLIPVLQAMLQKLRCAPLKSRHLVGVACIWVLALHFSQLMAKSDDGPSVWTPPVEPPGSVIVTSLNALGAEPAGRAQGQAQGSNTISDVASTQASGQDLPVAWPAGLREALDQWSEAWRQQEVAHYLDMYARDFSPTGGMSRQAWANARSSRILGKQNIRHEIRDLTFRKELQTVTVKFTQIYQDDRFQAVDQKTMQWVQRDGRWWILRERTS